MGSSHLILFSLASHVRFAPLFVSLTILLPHRISYNDIREYHSGYQPFPASIVKLDVSENDIKGNGFNFDNLINSLQQFNVSKNKLTSFNTTHNNWTSLETINLSFNKIKTITDTLVAPKLKVSERRKR